MMQFRFILIAIGVILITTVFLDWFAEQTLNTQGLVIISSLFFVIFLWLLG